MEDKNTGKHQPFEYTPDNQGLFARSRDREPQYAKSETSKWRALTVPFCRGIGVDIGAAGDPVVPNAICVDLPQGYCAPFGPVPTHVPMDGRFIRKVFRDYTLDFVYSSHLLEDFGIEEGQEVIRSWAVLVKPGGYMVLVVPEVSLWRRAVERGQPPNMNHRHEFALNELSEFFRNCMAGNWFVVCETIPDPEDYSIVFAARRRTE